MLNKKTESWSIENEIFACKLDSTREGIRNILEIQNTDQIEKIFFEIVIHEKTIWCNKDGSTPMTLLAREIRYTSLNNKQKIINAVINLKKYFKELDAKDTLCLSNFILLCEFDNLDTIAENYFESLDDLHGKDQILKQWVLLRFISGVKPDIIDQLLLLNKYIDLKKTYPMLWLSIILNANYSNETVLLYSQGVNISESNRSEQNHYLQKYKEKFGTETLDSFKNNLGITNSI